MLKQRLLIQELGWHRVASSCVLQVIALLCCYLQSTTSTTPASCKTKHHRVSLGGAGGLHEPEVDPPEGQAVKDVKVRGGKVGRRLLELCLRLAEWCHVVSLDSSATAQAVSA